VSEISLQQRYSPASTCFGCGPANALGLRIASFEGAPETLDGPDIHPGELVADWQPLPHHAAFDGVLNGGIIGTLLDCHSNWAAAIHLMHADDAVGPPGCVTAEMTVRFRRPTPSDAPLRLRAWPVDIDGRKVVVDAELVSGGIVTATCHATFVAVGPDHPAYERW
jgi:acyl-coenzyme A thioesterase PaaI-like protein